MEDNVWTRDYNVLWRSIMHLSRDHTSTMVSYPVYTLTFLKQKSDVVFIYIELMRNRYEGGRLYLYVKVCLPKMMIE